MKKINILFVLFFISLMGYSQMESDNVYFRFNLGIGIGFQSYSHSVLPNATFSSIYSITPGTHFSPEIAIGTNIIKGLNAEVSAAYLIQFAYNNQNGYVQSSSFMRLYTSINLKYSLELKNDRFALTPGIGLGYIPAAKYKNNYLGEIKDIQYGSTVGIYYSLEAQIRLGDKLILNPGLRYRTESYTAKSISNGDPVSSLPSSLQVMKSNGVQIVVGLIIPFFKD